MIGRACHSISTPIKNPIQSLSHKPKTLTTFITPVSKIKASSRKEITKKKSATSTRNPRRLITISTSDGKWHGQWTCDYIFSLDELDLADLAEDGQKSTEVSVNLLIQKHAGFGFSIDGRITTTFTRKCSNCFSTYCKKIDTAFDVWVLPSTIGKKNNALQLPEIGGDDPSLSFLTHLSPCSYILRIGKGCRKIGSGPVRVVVIIIVSHLFGTICKSYFSTRFSSALSSI